MSKISRQLRGIPQAKSRLTILLAFCSGWALQGEASLSNAVFYSDFQLSALSTDLITETNLNLSTPVGSWTVDSDEESDIVYESGTANQAMLADKGAYDFTANFDLSGVLTDDGVTISLDTYLRRTESDDSNFRPHTITGYDSLGNDVFIIYIDSSSNLSSNGQRVAYADVTGERIYLGNPGDVIKKGSDDLNSSKFRTLSLTLHTSDMDIAFGGVTLTNDVPYFNPGSTHISSLRIQGSSGTGAFYDNVVAMADVLGATSGWERTGFVPYSAQGENLFHITTADFDGVGAKDFVVGMSLEGNVIAFQRPDLIEDPSASTNRLWEYQTPCSFNIAISAGEADSTSPGDEILVPGTDGRLRILSSTGSLLWDWAIGDGAMYCANVGKTASGDIRIVTGGVDGYLRVLDENGTVLHEERPSKWGVMKFVAVGNFDGVGGDEAIMFHQYGGFTADERFVLVDLDTLARPTYWASSGVNYSASAASQVYDMDGDGDDELVGSWGVLHPENGEGTQQVPDMLSAGEYLSGSDYEAFAESTTMSYETKKIIPGNFRDWSDHPGPELARFHGHNLYLANYDTNRSVNVDRLRVTDYGYAHQLYHFMSIARLENRNGGPDRLVLSGVSNGDDHFYVVELNSRNWKSDAKYIDGRGVLGEVRDTYDALDADIQAFSGTVAAGGKPIWWTGSFSGYLGTWDKTDPVKVAEFADGVKASMDNFAENIGGDGHELQRIYPTVMLSAASNGETVEPAATNGLVNIAAALAQKGAHSCLILGKGDDLYIDPDHFADIFEASVTNGHCYLMARTKELSHTEYSDAYIPHMDAVIARAQEMSVSLGYTVHPPKIMFTQKGVIWSVMDRAQFADYFPAYKDIIVPAVENSNVTEQDWTIGERAGLWLHGDVEEWGCNLIGDILTPNREVISAADMRNGHAVLRHLLSQYALGATRYRITSLQSSSNPLYERDGIGSEFSSAYRHGIRPFLRMVEFGVYPNGPDRGRLKSVSPLAVALDDQNTGRLKQVTYNRDFDDYTPPTQSYVLDKLACWDAYTDVPDFDVTAIMYNTKRRWHALLPNSAAGFVPLVPYADRAEVESNAWCDRAYQTDGDTWSDFADLESARDALRAELMSVRSNMLFYVDGECFWQVTEEQNDPNTLYVVVMDSNVQTPTARTVQLKKGSAGDTWQVIDQLDAQGASLGQLATAGDAVMVDIPAGGIRILVLQKSNYAPVWDGGLGYSDAVEDEAYVGWTAWRVSDADGDPISFAKVSGPGWISVNTSNGKVSGTPEQADVGPVTLVISASDGVNAPLEAVITFDVDHANDAPVFSTDPLSAGAAIEGIAYSDTLAGTATDEDPGDALTYSKVSGPAWLNVAADGTLSGTPGATDVGTNTFTVMVEDAVQASGTSTLAIMVNGWAEQLYDDFEGGFGNWISGGSDCKLYTDGTFAHQGNNAVNLRDDSSTSVLDTSNQALSGMNQIRVDFWCIPDSMDGSEGFWLQISTDDGASYTTVKAWVNAVDFTNGVFFQDSVVISGYTLTDQTRLRFRCDASGNGDDIYLDEVRVSVK